MRWVIFCWSKSNLPPRGLREDDVIVCADSGVEYARRCGVTPSIVLGDFDSYSGDLPSHTELIRLPKEKDDTDTMFAVRLGLERGVSEFLIAGGIGGRLDHTLGAVQTLNFIVSNGASACMSDGIQSIEILSAPVAKEYFAENCKYFSVLALTPEVSGLTLQGVKYPLNNASLTYDFPLGISNEILAAKATLSVALGRIAVVQSSD